MLIALSDRRTNIGRASTGYVNTFYSDLISSTPNYTSTPETASDYSSPKVNFVY